MLKIMTLRQINELHWTLSNYFSFLLWSREPYLLNTFIQYWHGNWSYLGEEWGLLLVPTQIYASCNLHSTCHITAICRWQYFLQRCLQLQPRGKWYLSVMAANYGWLSQNVMWMNKEKYTTTVQHRCDTETHSTWCTAYGIAWPIVWPLQI